MQTDYSVELGADDPALELPWSAEDGTSRYFNIRQHPDLVLNVPEAVQHPELSEFLSRINAPGFPLETAKCDAWFSQELFPEEEIFGASCKFVSYVDLLFSAADVRLSLEKHESFLQNICRLLERAPEMSAGLEFVLRRCYYHEDGRADDSTSGYSITAYISGYGDSHDEALQRWAIALKLLQNALVQISLA